MIFEVLGRFWDSKNPKKLMKIGLEKLRDTKNEAKRAQGRLRERKMSQHEAPKEFQGRLRGVRKALALLRTY